MLRSKAIVEPKSEPQNIDFWGRTTHKRGILSRFPDKRSNRSHCVGPQKLRWPRAPHSLNRSLTPSLKIQYWLLDVGIFSSRSTITAMFVLFLNLLFWKKNVCERLTNNVSIKFLFVIYVSFALPFHSFCDFYYHNFYRSNVLWEVAPRLRKVLWLVQKVCKSDERNRRLSKKK